MKRVCVFCGATTKLTREHVWPNWLNSFITDPNGFTYTLTEAGTGTEDLWEHAKIAQTVRLVCKDCNNGWMAGLEGDNRPLLENMILGNPLTLSTDEQHGLSRWSFKTALMARLVSSENRFFPKHYEWLFRAQEPPPSISIRLGRYTGDKWVVYLRNANLRMESSLTDPETEHGYLTTVTIGHFVLQAIGHGGTEPVSITHRAPGAFIQIWPVVGPKRWPPLYGMGDDALDAAGLFHGSTGTDT